MTLLRILAQLTLVLLPCIAGAQAPRYARPANDTLRYTERTESRVQMQASAMNLDSRLVHDATLAIDFTGGDTARAWYERLELTQTGTSQPAGPTSTAAMLGKPFTLTVESNGRVEALDVPTLPPEIASTSDLTHQFDDFFITLPAQPLVRGVTWADTSHTDRAGMPGATHAGTFVRSYRVDRDTLVQGARAVIIAVRTAYRSQSSSPMPGGGAMTATSILEGEEIGEAVFAPAEGWLLGRTKTGSLKGTISVTGGRVPVSLPQQWEYTSTIRLVR